MSMSGIQKDKCCTRTVKKSGIFRFPLLNYSPKGDRNMDILNGLNRAMSYIEENICEDIDLDAIARAIGYSPYYFSKIFCCLTGISLSE